MQNRLSTHHQKGITLIELVIAMAVTAIVGVISASMLRVMTSNSQQIEQHQQALNKLQRDLTLIQSDLDQIALRFNGSTDSLQPTNIATASESYVPGLILEFSRFVTRPNGYYPQTQFERVRYTLEDEQLIRLSQPVDSPASEQLWNKQTLLEQLDEVSAYLLFNRWQESIPRQGKKPLRAIKLTFNSRKWGELELIGLLSGGKA